MGQVNDRGPCCRIGEDHAAGAMQRCRVLGHQPVVDPRGGRPHHRHPHHAGPEPRADLRHQRGGSAVIVGQQAQQRDAPAVPRRKESVENGILDQVSRLAHIKPGRRIDLADGAADLAEGPLDVGRDEVDAGKVEADRRRGPLGQPRIVGVDAGRDAPVGAAARYVGGMAQDDLPPDPRVVIRAPGGRRH